MSENITPPNAPSDHQLVVELVHEYAQAIHHGDVTRLRATFHPKAYLFGEVGGQPYLRSLDDYLDVVAQRQSPASLGHAYAMRPLGIDLQGHIGVARLDFPLLGHRYIDYLSLLKHQGKWLVANKTFTDATA